MLATPNVNFPEKLDNKGMLRLKWAVRIFILSKQKKLPLPSWINCYEKKLGKNQNLQSFGTIETVTQTQIDEVMKLGEFIVPGDALGLFASLRLG